MIFLLIYYSRLLVGNGSKFAEKLNICLDKAVLSWLGQLGKIVAVLINVGYYLIMFFFLFRTSDR